LSELPGESARGWATAARRTGGAQVPRVVSPLVQWLFTGLLILVSAGLAAYTGYLVRRLFTTSPGVADVPSEPAR
jgi:hypothetical protein